MADFSIYKGDYWEKDIFLKDSNKRPVNLTGYKIYLTLKTLKTVVDGSATLQKNWTPTGQDAKEGKVTLSITSAESNAITPDTYVYDVRFIESYETTAKPKVVFEGTFEVKDTVTDAIS